MLLFFFIIDFKTLIIGTLALMFLFKLRYFIEIYFELIQIYAKNASELEILKYVSNEIIKIIKKK